MKKIADNLLLEAVIIPKSVTDLLLKQNNPIELMALYEFYYYTGKWQKTNQPKCNDTFTAKALNRSRSTIIKYRKQLEKLKLIECIKKIEPTTKKIKGFYIQVHFLLSKKHIISSVKNIDSGNTGHCPTGVQEESTENSKSQCLNKPTVAQLYTNALSTNNRNALSLNKKNILDFALTDENTSSSLFSEYYEDSSTIPTKDEVKSFVDKNSISINPESFHNYYSANDWTANGKPIKNWKKLLKAINENGVFC